MGIVNEILNLSLNALGALILGAVAIMIASDIKAWRPNVTHWALNVAVSRLPKKLRARFSEQWASDIEDIPGDIPKIIFALDLIRGAIHHARDQDRRLRIKAILFRGRSLDGWLVSALVCEFWNNRAVFLAGNPALLKDAPTSLPDQIPEELQAELRANIEQHLTVADIVRIRSALLAHITLRSIFPNHSYRWVLNAAQRTVSRMRAKQGI